MNKYAAVMDQDELVEIFRDVYLLRGSIRIGPFLRMNRNMVIVRQGSELTIINAVRLNEHNHEKLNALGTVKHIIRLGDFHGLDDQYYLDTYQADFWSQKQHQTYAELIPNQIIETSVQPPLVRSQFFVFQSAKFPEAALLLKDQQLLITTDSVQYWDDWKHTSLISQWILSLMGIRLGLFIGGPWLKRVSLKKGSLKHDFEQLLDLDFQHLVAAHGNVLNDDAKFRLAQVVAQNFS